MANYLITGSRNNTPHITSMDDASLNAGIIGNGAYILNRGEKLRAEMTTANNCRIYDGDLVAQGRHVRIETSEYIDLTVNNGTVGMKRNDLVVARYENDVETGVESVGFVVIEGTPSATPSDPEYNEGNIFDGDLIVDFPLYRIKLDGISAGTPERLCEYAGTTLQPKTTYYNTPQGTWKVREMQDGFFEASIYFNSTVTATNQDGSMFYSNEYEWAFPFKISQLSQFNAVVGRLGYICNPSVGDLYNENKKFKFRVAFPSARSAETTEIILTISGWK